MSYKLLDPLILPLLFMTHVCLSNYQDIFHTAKMNSYTNFIISIVITQKIIVEI